MSLSTPRRVDDMLLQLGVEAVAGTSLDPDGALSYNVEDLQTYLPSRRTRVSGSIQTIPAAGGRRSLLEIAGIAKGGLWVEHLANRSANVVLVQMLDPSLGTSITNDRTDGWEFAATTYFDELFLGGLYPITGDVLPWSKQTPNQSILSVGTTSLVPIQQNRLLLQPGAVSPATPFWVPPNWLCQVIASVVLQQINNIDYVLTLPPLGVTT